ncbi:MAG: hypothetical protein JW959_05485 [Pirellulales bacterium]|nr:hypothetical protein [Pirellulales bacterium]
MALATLAPERSSTSNLLGDELVLRICGPSHDSRVARLKSRKCTIGSGQRCTLRLCAPGVAPLHCLIVRGRAAAVVRRWDRNTLLNHGAFTDAPLAAGDRLNVGPIEIEVVSIGAQPRLSKQEAPPQDTADRAELDAEKERFDQLRSRWQTEREETQRQLDEQRSSLDARANELETQLQALDDKRRRWKSERSDEENRTKAQIEQLHSRHAELESQQRSFDEYRKQWQAEQKEARRQLDERRAQLDAQAADIESRRNALADERRRWEDERKDGGAHAAAEAERLQTQRAELEAERNSLEEQRNQWQNERKEEHRELEEQRVRLIAETAELERQRDALADERSQGKNEQQRQPSAESQEPEFHAPEDNPPVDLEAVFRRLGVGAVPPAAEPESTPPAPEGSATSSPADDSREKPRASLGVNEREEESIDDYMSRLMERVRGAAGGSPITAFTPPPPAPATDASVKPIEPAQAAAPAAQRREPVQVAPRAKAPEKHLNLSAMRELANLSAQTALSRYARRVLISSMYSKLLIALVALAVAFCQFWMWKTMTGLQITFYSALIALLVAIYWGLQYALLSGRLAINKSGHIEWHSPPGNSKVDKRTDQKNADDATPPLSSPS